MDLLKDLKMSVLNFRLVMMYIIHKILVLLKNQLKYLKDSIFECFFKEYDRLLLLFKFSQHILMESLILDEEKIIKDKRHLFRLKKEVNYTAIKLL